MRFGWRSWSETEDYGGFCPVCEREALHHRGLNASRSSEGSPERDSGTRPLGANPEREPGTLQGERRGVAAESLPAPPSRPPGGLPLPARLWIGACALGLLVFVGLPFLLAIGISFTNLRLGSPLPLEWVGWEQYARKIGLLVASRLYRSCLPAALA